MAEPSLGAAVGLTGRLPQYDLLTPALRRQQMDQAQEQQKLKLSEARRKALNDSLSFDYEGLHPSQYSAFRNKGTAGMERVAALHDQGRIDEAEAETRKLVDEMKYSRALYKAEAANLYDLEKTPDAQLNAPGRAMKKTLLASNDINEVNKTYNYRDIYGKEGFTPNGRASFVKTDGKSVDEQSIQLLDKGLKSAVTIQERGGQVIKLKKLPASATEARQLEKKYGLEEGSLLSGEELILTTYKNDPGFAIKVLDAKRGEVEQFVDTYNDNLREGEPPITDVLNDPRSVSFIEEKIKEYGRNMSRYVGDLDINNVSKGNTIINQIGSGTTVDEIAISENKKFNTNYPNQGGGLNTLAATAQKSFSVKPTAFALQKGQQVINAATGEATQGTGAIEGELFEVDNVYVYRKGAYGVDEKGKKISLEGRIVPDKLLEKDKGKYEMRTVAFLQKEGYEKEGGKQRKVSDKYSYYVPAEYAKSAIYEGNKDKVNSIKSNLQAFQNEAEEWNKKNVSNSTQKTVERRTSDGRIAIFDAETKAFIKYK